MRSNHPDYVPPAESGSGDAAGEADTATSAIAQRRERRQRKRRQLAIWGSAAAIVVFLGAIGGVSTMIVSALADPGDEPVAAPTATAEPAADLIEFPADDPATANGTGPCTTVSVMSSFENAEMVSALAAAYNAAPRDIAGSCVTVTTSREKSGVAASLVAQNFPTLADDQKPTVWIPDACTWVDTALADGATNLPEEGAPVGNANVVLAMPQPLAEAIGWNTTPPSWDDVFTAAGDADLWTNLGYPEWGGFKLGKTSPMMATSGEAAMFASYGAAAGSVTDLSLANVEDPAVTSTVQQHELSTSHYMATPEHFLWHARQAEDNGGSAADFLSAVIVDEKSVWDYNRGITSRDGVTRIESTPPAEPLVPIYPTDGHYTADNPAMRLSGGWIDPVESEAAADFIRFTHTAEGQSAVRASGYRDLNNTIDDAVAAVSLVPASPTGHLAFPEADVVTAVQASFPEVRKRANVLFLVDVSGSMDEQISPSDTKLSAAKHAIELALDHFTSGDDVGLTGFAQATDGSMLPGNLAPVDNIATSRDAFVAQLNAITSMGDTPLYQAVDTYAAQQAQSWSSDRINAIVLLSDGENDTPNAETIGAQQMIDNLKAMHHTTPVLIFTLAYGQDADVATLQSISSATGAHYYDATDPTKLDAVLGDLVTSF